MGYSRSYSVAPSSELDHFLGDLSSQARSEVVVPVGNERMSSFGVVVPQNSYTKKGSHYDKGSHYHDAGWIQVVLGELNPRSVHQKSSLFPKRRIRAGSVVRQAAGDAQVVSVFGSVVEAERPANDFEQKMLPLNGPFSPSIKLLKLWISGLNSHLDEGLEDLLDGELFDLENDQERLLGEFDRRLRDVIIKYALMKSYEQQVVKLSIAGRFSNMFMSAVYDKFLIRLDQGGEFFSMLSSELAAWLKEGSALEGSWGKLFVDFSGDFVLKTEKPKKKVIKGFRKAVVD